MNIQPLNHLLPALPPKIGSGCCHFGTAVFTPCPGAEVLSKSLLRAVPKRQAEFLAGRRCASTALSGIGVLNASIPIAPDRSPVWPDGTVGSISHTHGMAMAVAAHQGDYWNLGLDCETIMETERANELEAMILREGEIDVKPGWLSKGEFITLAFSAKESLYKAVYRLSGPSLDFQDAGISHISESRLELCLIKQAMCANENRFRFTVQFHCSDSILITCLAIDREHSVTKAKPNLSTNGWQ